jgi:hypothetical protein
MWGKKRIDWQKKSSAGNPGFQNAFKGHRGKMVFTGTR